MLTGRQRNIRLACACIALGAVLLGNWPQAGRADEWKDGPDTYNRVCSYCHETGVGPKITGRHLPAAYVQAIVRNGYKAMPAFRPSEIDDRILGELAQYMSNTEDQ